MNVVECVPNFSEGRNMDVLNEIKGCFKGRQIKLLNFSSDPYHNRSVATVVGDHKSVAEALLRAVAVAAQRIDMRLHTGEHPAIGATDVVPFVPIHNFSETEAIELARAVAQGITVAYGIPTYLYDRAAQRPQCKNLADIRKRGFSGLRERMKTLDYMPDFGELRPHPTAGATVVGVRKFLIAYNINLATTDVDIAKKIASHIRARDGGMPGVKALGMHVGTCAQVSMNLVDYELTTPSMAYAEVKRLAQAYGTEVLSGEVIGLIPRAALLGVSNLELGLEYPLDDVVLETKIPTAWLE